MIDFDTAARLRPGLLAEVEARADTRALVVDPRGRILPGPHGLLQCLAGRGAAAYMGRRLDGSAVVMVAHPEAEPQAVDLRDMPELTRAERALAATAVSVRQWQEERFCVRCGARCELIAAGWVARCPQCGSERYPRTDPCIIVAVTDAEQRLLLARAAHFPAGRMSVIAGYVEPAETLEAAVVREVVEEAGVHVESPRYVTSHPWPFPRSLMCAFTAHCPDPRVQVDGEEIVEAGFFTRAEVRARIEDGTLTLPTRLSVARLLISRWLAEDEGAIL